MPDKDIQPTNPHPPGWRDDLNPDFMAGQNMGLVGDHPSFEGHTAYDLKAAHRRLSEFTDDELKGIPVLPPGTRLEQGAVYIDLKNQDTGEFRAMGNMEATQQHWFVPKTEVDYRIWNRLIGVDNPERLGEKAS
jgi:hypothetical protein